MAVELDASNTGVLKNLSQDLPPGATRHYLNGTDNDSAAAKIIVDAPGAGKRLIVTHLSINVAAHQAISLNNGAATVLIGPLQLESTALGSSWQKDFKWGLELTANTAMYVKSDTDALFHIYVEYISAPA